MRPATAAAASSLLEAAEDAYQAALRVEASLGDGPNEAAVTAAVAAFVDAERAATVFCTAAEEVDGTRADSALNDEGHAAHTLVWDLKVTRAFRL